MSIEHTAASDKKKRVTAPQLSCVLEEKRSYGGREYFSMQLD